MDIQVADQRIFLFANKISPEIAKTKAWDKKMSAFDAVSKVAGFLSRTKDDDFELLYQEHRYQPFWHVVATSKYVYERSAQYQVPATGLEVKKITLQEKEYETTNGKFSLSVLEHCTQEEQKQVLVDGVSGKNNPDMQKYLTVPSQLVSDDLNKLVSDTSIIVPPEARVSAIMRDTLSKMITGIQADKILEETVKVTCLDLYYHPVYAFQYRWISKNKEGIIEVDGVTGEIKSGARVFSEYMGKVLDKDFLFDLGADATGMLIPGGNIAIKVAKRYLDTKDDK